MLSVFGEAVVVKVNVSEAIKNSDERVVLLQLENAGVVIHIEKVFRMHL